MKYTFTYKYISRILLICFLLQSCNNSGHLPTSGPLKIENEIEYYPGLKIQKSARQGFTLNTDFRNALINKLPERYQLGVAYANGDCFFDALAQCLNKINNTNVNTVKCLRMVCHEFYLKNKELVDSWNKGEYGGIDKGKDEYYMVQYTAEECEQYFHGRSPIWGRPDVEGIILCRQLNLEGVCVIEILQDPDTGQPVMHYCLVNEREYISSITEEQASSLLRSGNISILVNIQIANHFVPLVDREACQEQPDTNSQSFEVPCSKSQKSTAQDKEQKRKKTASHNYNITAQTPSIRARSNITKLERFSARLQQQCMDTTNSTVPLAKEKERLHGENLDIEKEGLEDQQEAHQPELTSSIHTEVLEAFQDDTTQVHHINLTGIKLSKQYLELLKSLVYNNSTIMYINWGEIPENCQQLKEEIDSKIIQNICNHTYHPNDYIHGLLARHVYNNPEEGSEVNLETISEELGHTLPTDTPSIWKVVYVKDGRGRTGHYSVLYVNETTRQAVLSFQGTNPKKLETALSNIKNSNGSIIQNVLNALSSILDSRDLREDLQGVLGNYTTDSQESTYKVTHEAIEYAKEHYLSLSFTGHSLGGYLAELAVAFCYSDFDYRHTRAVVFDSPGIGKKLDKITKDSGIRNEPMEFNTKNLPIISYNSAPNIVNTCNWHPGEIWKVSPELKWTDRWENRIKELSRMPIMGKLAARNAKWLLALKGHNLGTILALFDPNKGKPSSCVRMDHWPKANNKTSYLSKKGKVGRYVVSTFAGIVVPLIVSLLNPIVIEPISVYIRSITRLPINSYTLSGIVISSLVSMSYLFGGFIESKLDKIYCVTSSLIGFLLDRPNMNYTQYWKTLENLDAHCKASDPSLGAKFRLLFDGNYKESKLDPQVHIINKNAFNDADRFLSELYRFKDAIKIAEHKDLIIRILQNILEDYDIEFISNKEYIRLAPGREDISRLRDKINTILEVISKEQIRDITKTAQYKFEQFSKKIKNKISNKNLLRGLPPVTFKHKKELISIKKGKKVYREPTIKKWNLKHLFYIGIIILVLSCIFLPPLGIILGLAGQNNGTRSDNQTGIAIPGNPLHHRHTSAGVASSSNSFGSLEVENDPAIQAIEEEYWREFEETITEEDFQWAADCIKEAVDFRRGYRQVTVFEITPKKAAALAQSLQGTSVTGIKLLYIKSDDLYEVWNAFTKYLKGTYIRVIDLRFSQAKHLSDEKEIAEKAAEFARSLRGTPVLDLYLEGRWINNLWLIEFLRNLPGTRLKEIHMSGTRITDAFTKDLITVDNLNNTALEKVFLDGNPGIHDKKQYWLKDDFPYIEWNF